MCKRKTGITNQKLMQLRINRDTGKGWKEGEIGLRRDSRDEEVVILPWEID